MSEHDQGADTPVETEVAQDNATTQVEGTQAETGDETPPAVEKTFTQAELDAILEKKTAKLIRQREQERGRREAYEQQLGRIQPAHQPTGKPQLAQFNNDPEAYAEAVGDWKLEQSTQSQRAEQAQRSQSDFQAKRDDFMAELEETEGFNMQKFNKLPISQTMATAILESDMGTKLALHLTTNPDDATRIAALSPARQAAELGKLEAKLSTASTKKPSNAASPITPVGAKGSSVSTDLYDARLANDPEAWIAAYNKRNSKR